MDRTNRFWRWLNSFPHWHTVTLAIVALAMFAAGFFAGWIWDERDSRLPPPVSILPVPVEYQELSPNLLSNPGFEGGWTRDVLWWTPEGGPYRTPFGEIFTPEGWTTWWLEGFPCAGTSDWVMGRPEVGLIRKNVDPARVFEGNQAVKAFTFWRCHQMGLMQRITGLRPGAHYDLEAYGHAWYTRCSSRPHDVPLDFDCETRLGNAWDRLQVGIDPSGGMDPRAPAAIWSAPVEQYGVYGGSMALRGVKVTGSTVTVFLRTECNYPLKHNDVYWDAVSLRRVERVYLPTILHRANASSG